MVCSNLKFEKRAIIFEEIHGILSKPAQNRLLILTHLQGLSVIRPTELKLWPFKDALFNASYMYIVVQ